MGWKHYKIIYTISSQNNVHRKKKPYKKEINLKSYQINERMKKQTITNYKTPQQNTKYKIQNTTDNDVNMNKYKRKTKSCNN